MIVGLAIVMLFVLAAPAYGGRLGRLAEFELPNAWAVVAVFALQGVARGVSGEIGRFPQVVVWMVLSGILLCLLWSIRWETGVTLMMLGIALNLLVVGLNEAMPVAVATVAAEARGFYRPSIAGDVLPWLGDVLPAPDGWMLSLGDLLLFVGATSLLVSLTTRQTQRSSETSRAG